jgi:hypothetical protein
MLTFACGRAVLLRHTTSLLSHSHADIPICLLHCWWSFLKHQRWPVLLHHAFFTDSSERRRETGPLSKGTGALSRSLCVREPAQMRTLCVQLFVVASGLCDRGFACAGLCAGRSRAPSFQLKVQCQGPGFFMNRRRGAGHKTLVVENDPCSICVVAAIELHYTTP